MLGILREHSVAVMTEERDSPGGRGGKRCGPQAPGQVGLCSHRVAFGFYSNHRGSNWLVLIGEGVAGPDLHL